MFEVPVGLEALTIVRLGLGVVGVISRRAVLQVILLTEVIGDNEVTGR